VKVLLVEDSKFLKVATERALVSAGYEVISSGDGDQVLPLARQHSPALILLDIMLPKMSGQDETNEGQEQNVSKDCRRSVTISGPEY
jgi:DNA-binding response OmpR family regulator